jgi:hypothetical protein
MSMLSDYRITFIPGSSAASYKVRKIFDEVPKASLPEVFFLLRLLENSQTSIPFPFQIPSPLSPAL